MPRKLDSTMPKIPRSTESEPKPGAGAEARGTAEVKKTGGPDQANVYAEQAGRAAVTIAPQESTSTPIPAKGDIFPAGAVTEKSDAAPFGYWEGTHEAHGSRSPNDVNYHEPQFRRIAKRADFEIHGLKLLEAAMPKTFDKEVTITRADGTKATINLMKAADNSVKVDDFYAVLEEVLKRETFELTSEHMRDLGLQPPAGNGVHKVTGVQILQLVDQTIAEAERLSKKNPPEAAPMRGESAAQVNDFKQALRRFAIQTVFHSTDLTKIHTAMGFDPKSNPGMSETLKHDLVEWAPLKDLVWQLSRRPHDAWMDNWVRAEVQRQAPHLLEGITTTEQLYQLVEQHPELKFNCSALNPHFMVAMYSWGDSRED